jgi:hypothetical protein
MGLDMDAMIGGDYEKGLANLKAVAEAAPVAAPTPPAAASDAPTPPEAPPVTP